jgi:hypothetical protein
MKNTYRYVWYLLAKAECNFKAPFKFHCSVEVLQSVHAGFSIAFVRVAVVEDWLQGQLAAVVTVAQLQGQMARALETEVPGQFSFWFRTCRGSGQRILHATTARTQKYRTTFLLMSDQLLEGEINEILGRRRNTVHLLICSTFYSNSETPLQDVINPNSHYKWIRKTLHFSSHVLCHPVLLCKCSI